MSSLNQPRLDAVRAISSRIAPSARAASSESAEKNGAGAVPASHYFGINTFGARQMRDKLSADVNRIIARSDVSAMLASSGIEPAGTSPEAFAEVLRVDTPKWKQMIQEAGIKAD